MSAKKRRPFIFRITFRIVLIIAAAALLLSYISIFVNPEIMWLPLFFGLYFIPLLFINLFLLLYAIFKRSKAVWIPILALMPTLLFINLFVKVSNKEQSGQSDGLRIMTYNVGKFNASKNNLPQHEVRSSVFELIKEFEPSVVSIQEYYTADTSAIKEEFKDFQYLYHHLFKLQGDRWFGNITASRFPIIDQGYISFKGSTNLSIYTDIQYSDKVVRVYNTHLESYNISFTNIIKRPDREDQTLPNELIEVHDKMIGTNIKRGGQVNEILSHVAGYNGNTIICGDFNDTPMSYTYHRLSKNLKDSFLESGKGFSATYRYLWPLLRIDYILFPESFDSHYHITPKVPHSDHYPVLTDIIIP